MQKQGDSGAHFPKRGDFSSATVGFHTKSPQVFSAKMGFAVGLINPQKCTLDSGVCKQKCVNEGTSLLQDRVHPEMKIFRAEIALGVGPCHFGWDCG